ncbi:MAG: hypothetical protein ACKOTZ_05760 [Chloroflexota bacterium]
MTPLFGVLVGWVAGLLVTLAWIAFGLGVLALARRVTHVDRLMDHNDISGFVYTVVGAIYAVLLAFVVVGVWQRYDADRRTVETEAARTLVLYRAVGLIEGAADLQPAIRRYAERVVTDEWPAMAQGMDAISAAQALRDVALAAEAIPSIGAGTGWNTFVIDDLRQLQGSRTARLAIGLGSRDSAGGSALPGVLWVAIFLGGIVTVGYSALYGSRDRVLHHLITVVLATVVGLSVGVVVVLDAPYRGDAQINPEPFLRVIQLMDEPAS